MKNLFLLIFLFLFFNSFSQEKFDRIFYKATDIRMDDEKFKDYKKMLEEFEAVRKKLTFQLIYNKNRSYFDLIPIKLPNVSNELLSVAGGMLPGEYYYKDNHNSYRFNVVDGQCFKVNQIFEDEFAWEITNETKKILGLTCKKAIGEDGVRKITAWFTSEIPYSYGPKWFFGLPGMVLEVNTSTTKTYAIKITQDLIIQPPSVKKNCDEISSEDYRNHLKSLMGLIPY